MPAVYPGGNIKTLLEPLVAPRDNKKVLLCRVCKQSDDGVIPSNGPCLGTYHAACTGHSLHDGSHLCEKCYTGIRTCSECKKTSHDMAQCSMPSCGRYYHLECLSQIGITVRHVKTLVGSFAVNNTVVPLRVLLISSWVMSACVAFIDPTSSSLVKSMANV